MGFRFITVPKVLKKTPKATVHETMANTEAISAHVQEPKEMRRPFGPMLKTSKSDDKNGQKPKIVAWWCVQKYTIDLKKSALIYKD